MKLSVLILLCLLVLVPSLCAQTRYVSSAGSHTSPYDTWAKAANDIQTAVSIASEGDTVWVTNGTYTGINTEVVKITNGITLSSVNGLAVTTVDAENVTGRRVFVLEATASNAVIDGFTITLGRGGTSSPGAGVGGGLYILGGHDRELHDLQQLWT